MAARENFWTTQIQKKKEYYPITAKSFKLCPPTFIWREFHECDKIIYHNFWHITGCQADDIRIIILKIKLSNSKFFVFLSR